MSKIDLSQYDFKEVLEWVCEQFPDDSTLEKDRYDVKYKIHGYEILNVWALHGISNSLPNSPGLRNIVEKMKKTEEIKSLYIFYEKQDANKVTLKELAELLKPYLKDE